MSTPCTDCCIISTPNAPPSSLRIEAQITEGVNLIKRQVSTAIGYYPTATGVTEINQVLAPAATLALPGVVDALILKVVSGPVNVTYTPTTTGATPITTVVNQMWVIDSPISAVTITNPAVAGGNTAQVQAVYVMTPA